MKKGFGEYGEGGRNMNSHPELAPAHREAKYIHPDHWGAVHC
jgi:hypothetical protein